MALFIMGRRLAETRFKKLMKKAGKEGVEGMRGLLTDIVSETVRKTLAKAVIGEERQKHHHHHLLSNDLEAPWLSRPPWPRGGQGPQPHGANYLIDSAILRVSSAAVESRPAALRSLILV